MGEVGARGFCHNSCRSQADCRWDRVITPIDQVRDAANYAEQRAPATDVNKQKERNR
jgi:hypothetical protein